MFWFESDVTIGPRVTAWLALLIVLGYAGIRLVDRFASGARPSDAAAPAPPRAALDTLNPGIWIAGGVLPASNQHLDTITEGPFSTRDEGFRRLEVPGFWIQQHEVTNAEYRRFDPGHAFAPGDARHPVVDVTWEQAMAYARWLGGSLPSEVQWQFAASGTEGREYPWGDAEPTCERAHFAGCRPESTIPVMSLPAGATPQGVYDLAGNVWEWVTPEWFVAGKTPVNHQSRGLRGGSFRSSPFFLRASNRSNDYPSGFEYRTIGFRVVWSVKGHNLAPTPFR